MFIVEPPGKVSLKFGTVGKCLHPTSASRQPDIGLIPISHDTDVTLFL